jgi:hypothetical protein
MICPVRGRGTRTAIIRDNEATTQNHSGGEAVLQDLSNRITQSAMNFDGKRRSNFIDFAKQRNDIFAPKRRDK